MSGTADERDTRPNENDRGDVTEYPTDHVVGVLDTAEQLTSAVDGLIDNGFPESDVIVECGPASAERLAASPGRRGLAGLAIRIAERLGVENIEMELKDRYEDALRDGKFVLIVAAPAEARKQLAADVLREHGAYTVAFLGRFTIEGIVPPNES